MLQQGSGTRSLTSAENHQPAKTAALKTESEADVINTIGARYNPRPSAAALPPAGADWHGIHQNPQTRGLNLLHFRVIR